MVANEPPKQPRQQLSKGMEHIRYAVTVDPSFRPKQSQSPSPAPAANHTDSTIDPTDNNDSNTKTDSASIDSSNTYGVPSSIIEPIRLPASSSSSRSHDPANNLKRTDPFQFGSRYLQEGDNIFEFNAWDHVEVDSAYKEFAEQQFAAQRAAPVKEFERNKYLSQPEKYWDYFYTNNAQNFFKDRKWLRQEFPVLDDCTREGRGPVTLLEVGAGAGNTAFPILALNQNKDFTIHACDFSKVAVEVIRKNEAYAEPPVGRIQADVWDAASDELPPGLGEASCDAVLMVFIFSALTPTQWKKCVHNVWKVLKPGGQVLFRDYGRGDLAQVRFKKGRYLDENFYVRGDGTRVYFFEEEELREIWTQSISAIEKERNDESATAATAAATNNGSVEDSLRKLAVSDETTAPEEASSEGTPSSSSSDRFQIKHIGTDRRLLVNRQRKLKMYRCWMQAILEKPAS